MKFDLISIMEKKAKKKPVKIVVCEGWDERCIGAVADILKNKLATIVLLGDKTLILEKAKELNADVSDAEFHDYKNSDIKDKLVDKLVELRAHKGMDKKTAEKLLEDENYFGCVYAAAGYADAVAGSAIGSTAALMKPSLQILRKKAELVSEVCSFTDVKNDRTIFGTDFSMNIEPTPEELAQMTLNAVEAVRSFDIEPKVGMLSFSSKGSGGDGPQIQVVRDALKIVKEKDKKLLIDGELQVDAAVNPWAAQRKCKDSPLAGEANTLIFPNLTASNIFAHAIGQFSDMTLDFSMLMGMQKPVVILGRSTPEESIRNMIVSCAFQVNSK